MDDSRKTANKNIKIGLIISYVTMVISILMMLFYTPFCLEKLGDTEYGLRSFATSITSYLSILSLGLSSAYIKFRIKSIKQDEENGEKKFNAVYLIVFSIIALIALLIGFVFILLFRFNVISLKDYAGSDKSILIKLLIILVINISISFPLGLFIQYCTAREKIIWVRLITLAVNLSTVALGVFVLLIGYKSVALTLTTLIINIVFGFAHILYCFLKLKMKLSFKLQKKDFSVVKEMLIFSIFIGINIIVDELNSQTDPIIIGLLISAEAVTVFNLGRQFREYLMLMSVTISSSFTQRVNVYVSENKEEELNNLFITVSSLQMIILFLVTGGFIACGKEFITLWIGEDKLQVYDIATCIMAIEIVPLSQNLSIEIQRAKNKHQFRAYAYLIIAFFNTLISVILCKYMGIMGCVIGTVVTLIVGQYIIINIYNARVIHLPIKKYWITYARFFVTTAAAIGLTFLLSFTLPKTLGNIWSFLIKGIAFVLFYVALNLLVNKRIVFTTLRSFVKGDL